MRRQRWIITPVLGMSPRYDFFGTVTQVARYARKLAIRHQRRFEARIPRG